MDEMKLVVPKFVSVARSFTQKINLANHVKGHDYESVDFFASRSRELPEVEAKSEVVAKLSAEMYAEAKEEVERAITDYIRALKGETGEVVAPTAEELTAIASWIAKINESNKDNIDKVAQEIAAIKDKLNESQVVFLRQLVLKVKNQ